MGGRLPLFQCIPGEGGGHRGAHGVVPWHTPCVPPQARKQTCDVVANMLVRKGHKAGALHGDKEQAARERTLEAFRTGRTPVLVATDVAARGLDVKGVRAVINYDLANNTEDYVHRIGRTGRAGLKGAAYTFVTRSSEDGWKAMGIAEVMEKAGQTVPPAVQV